ncbi:MAG: RidA family protein [Methylobacteriaceae bacterium]|nr:RidA family protein [Methylobacteriaceae bacterium]
MRVAGLRNAEAANDRLPGMTHDFLYPSGSRKQAWRSTDRGSRFDKLVWVSGQSDKDKTGNIRNPGRAEAQIDAVMRQINAAVEHLGARATDVVKLVVFHTVGEGERETELLRHLRKCFAGDVPPAISLISAPHLADPGAVVTIKAIAVDNSDGSASRFPSDVRFDGDASGLFSQAVRCGEFVFVSAQSAKDKSGRIVHTDDIVAQAKITVENIARVLESVGCDLDDVVKLNTWYVGYGTDADWRRAAEVRSNAFRFPGPGATGVPVPNRYPDGALIRQECLALRGTNGDRLPRMLSWPLGHWDWPIRVSFQQGIRVGRFIILGGQYSMDEKGLAVAPDDMAAQTEITLEFIRRILAGFGARMEDLVEVTAFYKSSSIAHGTPLAPKSFGPQRPAVTEIPLATLGLERVTLEVEGFAMVDD